MFTLICIGTYGEVYATEDIAIIEDACWQAQCHAQIDGGNAWVISDWGRVVHFELGYMNGGKIAEGFYPYAKF